LTSALDGDELSALHAGKEPWHPLDRRLGAGEEKNSQSLLGLGPPIIQSVAQRHTTELSRLQRDGNIQYL